MNNEMPLFATLACAKRDREQHVRELVNKVISAGFQLLVVVTRPPLFELEKTAMIGKGKGFRMYAISKSEGVESAVRLLARMKLWHKPIFHVLIGNISFKEQALKALADKTASLSDIEQALTPYIVGFLDPLDDALECYGTQEVQGIFDTLTWNRLS